MSAGRLKPDGEVLLKNGDVNVTKIAIDPVWHIPGWQNGLVLMNINFEE